jgi:hypothetical protein
MPLKLTESRVRAIRRALKGGARSNALAERYRVDYRTVYSIAVGETWRHLGPPVQRRRRFRRRHHSAKYGPAFARRVLALRRKGLSYPAIAARLRMPASGFLTVRRIVLGTHWSVRKGGPARREVE